MHETAVLEIGDMAPEFRLKGPGGQFISLTDLRGARHVLLVFFPLAFSPVCSHQLPDIQRRLDDLRDLRTEVMGISVDSHYANEAFAQRLGIEFPLLSDFKREASAAYGVLLGEKGYSGRALFAVDKQGRLIHKAFTDAIFDPNQVPSLDRVIDALRAAQ